MCNKEMDNILEEKDLLVFQGLVVSTDVDDDLWLAVSDTHLVQVRDRVVSDEAFPLIATNQVFLNDHQADIVAASKVADFIYAWIQRRVQEKLEQDYMATSFDDVDEAFNFDLGEQVEKSPSSGDIDQQII